ncbi:MAG: hypothetical protein IJP31_03335 [Lachnospiraceae bacterium]|nr:hypothetical protein [Lachnospiraceae bacterium]
MFDANELETLDAKYFTIIYRDPYDVTIRSKNTGHYWSLHSPDCPENNIVVIFHFIRTLWLCELSALKPLIFKDSRNKKFA